MIDVTWSAQPGSVADQINPMSITSDPASTTRLLDLVRDTIEATLAKVLAEVRQEADQSRSPPRPSTKTGFELKPADMALPAPVKFGRLTKWRLAEIIEWIEADCPPQKVWVHVKSSKRKGR